MIKLRRMLMSREEMLMLMLMLMSREEMLMLVLMFREEMLMLMLISREEMLIKLEEKEKRLKESLSFAGKKAGDLTDSG